MCLVQAHKPGRGAVAAAALLQCAQLDVAGVIVGFKSRRRAANTIGAISARGDELNLAENRRDASCGADGGERRRRHIESLAHITEDSGTGSS